MNYFKNKNNEIFAYDDEQIEQGYGSDLTAITEAELFELQKPTQAELDGKKVAEAKSYLASTDWIVTKIAELQLEGVDVEPLKVKYADELAERKLMREAV